METRTLLRGAGSAAIAAGALRIVSSFIPFVSGSAALESLYLVIDLGFLFGLIGFYTARAGGLGWLGLTGFVLALAATALITGPDPVFAGIDIYQTGSLILVAGLAVMAIAMLVGRIGPLWAALAWLGVPVAVVAGTAAGQPALGFMTAGILVGAGFIGIGLALVQRPQAD